MPRSRGALSGLFLVLLGAWGGIAPYIGPSFGYGFGRAWEATPGRLYLSAAPGFAAALAGLVILVTRSRWLGGFWALVAALSGAWLVAGAAVVRLLPASLGTSSITADIPANASASKVALVSLGFYAGVGVAIVFFAALASGRFSIAAHKDHARFATGLAAGAGAAGSGPLAYDAYQLGQAQAYAPASTQYYPGQPQYPTAGYPSAYPPDSYQQDQYPTVTFPADQYPPGHDPFTAVTGEAYPAPETAQAPPYQAPTDPFTAEQGTAQA